MYRKIIQEGFRESYNFIGSGLVDMYANCGLLEEALNVYDVLRVKPLLSWNVINCKIC